VLAVCDATEHSSSKQITIKPPQYTRLERVPYSRGRPALVEMRSECKCTVKPKVQHMILTMKRQRADRYNVFASWASSHRSQRWNHISQSQVPPAGHHASHHRCMGAIRAVYISSDDISDKSCNPPDTWCVSQKRDMAVFSFFLGSLAFCNGPIM